MVAARVRSAGASSSSSSFAVMYLLVPLLLLISVAQQSFAASSGGSAAHFEPQVAALCDPGAAYHPQFMNDQGRWETDLKSKPTAGSSCMKDKMDILNYCKKVYPTRDITNIVEASHYLKVGGWCRLGATNPAKCKAARWVKPFRCLEGPFQSDALLVPEGCLFDHIHNQSHCWQFGRWNLTAGRACQERGLQLRSFAMLLPCGISLFSGVEFVCCPKHFNDISKTKKPIDLDLLKPESDLLAKDDDLLTGDGDATDEGLDDDDDDDEDDTEDLDEEDDEQEMADEPASNNGATDVDEDDIDDNTDEDEYDDAESQEDDDDDETADSNDPLDEGFGRWEEAVSSTRRPTTGAPTAAPPRSTTPPPPVTQRPSESPATQDPYFTHFDPRIEHQSFKDAQQRLEETHREKVTKVMKEWSELEERYQEMRAADPRGAAGFRKRMTTRFQAGVRALERAGAAEQRRLAALHQQRVLAHIAQRRRDALACYTKALADSPPNTHRVQKCLQKLLRALHKDRAHAIAHYRHLLAGGPEGAAAERPRTLERLVDIDRTVNHSLQMLRRYPELDAKIGQLMDDYVQALRSKDETPGSMLSMTPELEAAILDKYRIEVEHKIAEKERIKAEEKMRKEQRGRQRADIRQERHRVEAVLGKKMAGTFEQESLEDDDESLLVLPAEDTHQSTSSSTASSSSIPPSTLPASVATPTSQYMDRDIMSNTQESQEEPSPQPSSSSGPAAAVTVDDAAVQRLADEAAAASRAHPDPPPAHAMVHDIGHGEPGYSVRREVYGGGGVTHASHGLYLVVCVGVAALLGAAAIGVAVVRRRNAASPHAMGFVETGPCVPPTPEERHVANMQINGYENPTYKYFEVKE
ncbi:amyloid-beta-like protein isoform X3 [Arctopsyche grandis]|uniref:amyloid-beta-like protein isoform X3 n=1 Tax=Arctopsyche grandis TaxID=121162 RepID=UPI00406D7109